MNNFRIHEKALAQLSASYPIRIFRKLTKLIRNKLYSQSGSFRTFIFINSLFIFTNLGISLFIDNLYIIVLMNINLILCIYYIYYINKKIYRKFFKHQRLIQILGIDEDVEFEEQNRLLNQLLNSNKIDDSNFEVYSRNLPKNLFGGDFIYQQKDIYDNYWFAIGDSSGHDLNSHLYSISILLRLSYLINKKGTPRDIHIWIDKSLEDTIRDNELSITKYASLLVLSSDSSGNFMHFGQHPNLIIFRSSSGACESVHTSGGFIGLTLPGQTGENNIFRMNSGDILFTFTDGFFEQKNPDGKYYGTKLYDYIERGNKDDLEKFSQNLYLEIKNFTGGEFNDDMSILIIKKK